MTSLLLKPKLEIFVMTDEERTKYCGNPQVKVVECEFFYGNNNCPNTCEYARTMKQYVAMARQQRTFKMRGAL
jgi:hypothetical protein